MNHVNCLNPVLIVNPQINQSCVRFTHVVVDGYLRRITDEQRFLLLQGQSPSSVLHIPYAHNLHRENYNHLSDNEFDSVYSRLEDYLEHSFLLNSETAETLPLYQFVKCGHCDVCNSSKLSSIIQRCAFQAELYNTPVYFVTLTYNSAHYLLDVRRSFTNFKKRLKSNVDNVFQTINQSNEKYSDKIKFLSVCEIGKRGRHHWHTIIFGLPYFSEIKSEQSFYVNKLIQYCWRDPERDVDNPLRFVDFFKYSVRFPRYSKLPPNYDIKSFGYVNVADTDNVGSTVKYITKYIFKNFSNCNFVCKSVSVNLGLSFVQKFRQIIKDSQDSSFEYKSRHDKEIHKVTLSKYYIDKLFPPDSKLFSSELRKSFFDCYLGCDELLSIKYSGLDMKPLKSFALMIKVYLEDRYPFMFDVFEPISSNIRKKSQFLDGVHFGSPDLKSQVVDYIDNLLTSIESDFDKISHIDFDYDDFLFRSLERCEYLEKLHSHDLSYSQLIDIASDFRTSIKRYQSISHI